MEKIIRQLTIVIAGGALALSFGCDLGLVPDETGQGAAGNGGSTDFAPDSIDGVTLYGTSTPGTGDLDSSGPYTLSFDGGTFVLVDSDGTTIGPYTYAKTGPNTSTGTITLTEGIITTLTTFTSATAGTFESTGSGGITGTQSGSFNTNQN